MTMKVTALLLPASFFSLSSFLPSAISAIGPLAGLAGLLSPRPTARACQRRQAVAVVRCCHRHRLFPAALRPCRRRSPGRSSLGRRGTTPRGGGEFDESVIDNSDDLLVD